MNTLVFFCELEKLMSCVERENKVSRDNMQLRNEDTHVTIPYCHKGFYKRILDREDLTNKSELEILDVRIAGSPPFGRTAYIVYRIIKK